MPRNPLAFTMAQRRKARGRFKARRTQAKRRISRVRSPGYGPIPANVKRTLGTGKGWK